MNFRVTLYIQGALLIFLGGMLLLPIPFALYYQNGQTVTFLLSSAIALTVGVALMRFFKDRSEITHREGFVIVTFAWSVYALFGSLPFLFSQTLTNPIDAYFESMAGFATVGASVITDLESVPESILFWRAATQWIGGMGFIVLSLAVLPLLGVGGMQLYRAEAPGPTADRLTPRIQDTARLLWGVYALLTAIGVAFLWFGEMSFFDAVCHAMAGIATGGFSTRSASLGAFQTYSQVVVIFLMFMGGANFSLHYYAIKGRAESYWKSDEFRFYVILTTAASAILFLFNLPAYGLSLDNVRDSVFTGVSILTTTGFAGADYESWPMLSQGLIFALMFFGGCAGSTAGGIKHVRILLLFRHAVNQIRQLAHPRQVLILKLDRRPVAAETMQDVLSLTVLFLGLFVAGSLCLAASGLDLITAGTAVTACITTVGPGLGDVGPTDNYAGLPIVSKIVLSFVMLLGRLEIFTVLVLFLPSLWKK